MSDARRAIEALRAGVPNRSAIRLLGTGETAIREHFLANLQRSQKGAWESGSSRGQVVAGGFGAGKSHLLGYLQELALNENFIVSWVAVSKETPLFDLDKLFIAAIRNATVPNRNDDAMTAVLARLNSKTDAFEDLRHWAEAPESELSPLFPALLHLLPLPGTTPDRMQKIARFLGGGKFNMADFRQWLREAGAAKLFPIKPIKLPGLSRQRLQFVSRLIMAAGYGGWVVLLDEVELIGRYSTLQRGRGYAELARWMGLDAEEAIPGIVTVAAITDDFKAAVIDKRHDEEQIPLKLTNKNERNNAARARLGIEALGKPMLLRSPNVQFLRESLEKARTLYASAYEWDPVIVEVGEISSTKSMRQYMKSWITAWDIERLYGGIEPQIETEAFASNYEENIEIEQAMEINLYSRNDE